MTTKDWADEKAEQLFDLVRAGKSDFEIIDALAEALREAALDGEMVNSFSPNEAWNKIR